MIAWLRRWLSPRPLDRDTLRAEIHAENIGRLSRTWYR